MLKSKFEQKLISFTDTPSDREVIRDDMENGWSIVSLLQHGKRYFGVMEKMQSVSSAKNSDVFYIPPKKNKFAF